MRGWTSLYLNNILRWMVRSNQLLSILIQLGDCGLLGLQTFGNEVLLRQDKCAE